MTPGQQKPKVRIVPKTPVVRIATAQEPPPPTIKSTQSKAKKPPKPNKALPNLENQHSQETLAKAIALSQQHPPMHEQAALQIILGHRTVEDWYSQLQERRARNAVRIQRLRELHAKKQEALQEIGGCQQESSWLYLLYSTRVPVCLETSTHEDLQARLHRLNVYSIIVKDMESERHSLRKCSISAIWPVSAQSQCLAMRTITGEPSQRNIAAPYKPSERWPFPHQLLEQAIGARIRAQLLNGSRWEGYLRWNNAFTFLLGEKPEGEAEVLIYKHACCGLEILTKE